jgi:hypothetical protein
MTGGGKESIFLLRFAGKAIYFSYTKETAMCDFNYEPPEVDMTEEEYEEYMLEKDMEDGLTPEMEEAYERAIQREKEEMEQKSVKDKPSNSSPDEPEKRNGENKDSSETSEFVSDFSEDIPF